MPAKQSNECILQLYKKYLPDDELRKHKGGHVCKRHNGPGYKRIFVIPGWLKYSAAKAFSNCIPGLFTF